MQQVAEALQQVLSALSEQHIVHMLGGSIASSVHGIHRSTRDIDIVADIRVNQVERLAASLGKEFYMDPATAAEALGRGRPFNIIHFASAYKFDIFPVPNDAYYRTQIERATSETVIFDDGVSVRCPVATAEDSLLAKLVWYRMGDEQSDQQWNDLRGIVSMQGNKLDIGYLRKWTGHLKVDDLLDRLLLQGES